MNKRDYYEVLGVSKSATDDEIKSIYNSYSFGNILDKSYKTLYDALKCDEKCFDDKYLFKMQYWKSYVTKNLPEGKKCDTLSQVFPELIPEPIELSYILNIE